MTENIKKLLAVVDEFPTIKRVEYDNQEHLEFITRVLTTLKAAGPEIRVLCEIESSKMVAELQANNKITLALITQLKKMVTEPDPILPSTLSIVREANTGGLPKPETERSTHSPEVIQNTAGTVEVPGQTKDTADKPAAAVATLAAARKAAALNKTPSEPAAKAPAKVKRVAAPRRAPSSIP